jgi:excisionase family DNA binding protein
MAKAGIPREHREKPLEAESPVLTLTEVADYLRVSRAMIYRLLKANELPAFKMGSDWRLNREDLEKFRSKGTKTKRKTRAQFQNK